MSSRLARPSSATTVMDDLRPNGGLARTTLGSCWWLRQRVAYIDQRTAIGLADAVKQHVHRRQPGRAVDQLDPADATAGEPVALLGRQVAAVMTLDVVMRGEQETARAAGRVADRVVRAGLDAVDHRGD